MILNSVFVFSYELFLVVIVILFATISSCIIAKFILQNLHIFNLKKSIVIQILLVILYLSVIVCLLYFTRLTLKKYILNDDLINSSYFIVGPIIGIFFLNKLFVKKIIKKYT